MAEDDDYQVGKGRPPKHTRFPKGQSGNPSGKKKCPTFRDEVATALSRNRSALVDGEPTVMTNRQWVTEKLIVMALGGNMRAATLLIANDNVEQEEGESEVVRGQDGLLERFAHRYLRRKGLNGGGLDG